MCVCRGKVTEGIDFTDELARAVIMVGVPYPPVMDRRVEQKKEYLDALKMNNAVRLATGKMDSKEWYLMQTVRTIN